MEASQIQTPGGIIVAVAAERLPAAEADCRQLKTGTAAAAIIHVIVTLRACAMSFINFLIACFCVYIGAVADNHGIAICALSYRVGNRQVRS